MAGFWANPRELLTITLRKFDWAAQQNFALVDSPSGRQESLIKAACPFFPFT